jgi:LmbE family N-acetylglucosaminyl deacetylase
MLEMMPVLAGRRALRILCLGAHCDDIEIGCGATLLALQEAGMVEVIDWVVLSGTSERRAEAQRAMQMLIDDGVRGELLHGEFMDGSMPGQYLEIKVFFESLKSRPPADIIFTHERDDRHQDHRVVNEMTWNTFRDHLVLEYEVPKWDGGLGQPNVFVPVTQEQAERKIQVLLSCHASQVGRDWFDRAAFEAILRLRGIESRAAAGRAEAFHARKILLGTHSSLLQQGPASW